MSPPRAWKGEYLSVDADRARLTMSERNNHLEEGLLLAANEFLVLRVVLRREDHSVPILVQLGLAAVGDFLFALLAL